MQPGARLRLGQSVLRFEVAAAPVPLELSESTAFGELRGRSAPMRRLFALLGRLAPRDTTVLGTGESGTGKELVARALHQESPSRRDGPFVVLDCGAMPVGLMESEIFGHQKGSFTGAVEARSGAFERADGGTLFLETRSASFRWSYSRSFCACSRRAR